MRSRVPPRSPHARTGFATQGMAYKACVRRAHGVCARGPARPACALGTAGRPHRRCAHFPTYNVMLFSPLVKPRGSQGLCPETPGRGPLRGSAPETPGRGITSPCTPNYGPRSGAGLSRSEGRWRGKPLPRPPACQSAKTGSGAPLAVPLHPELRPAQRRGPYRSEGRWRGKPLPHPPACQSAKTGSGAPLGVPEPVKKDRHICAYRCLVALPGQSPSPVLLSGGVQGRHCLPCRGSWGQRPQGGAGEALRPAASIVAGGQRVAPPSGAAAPAARFGGLVRVALPLWGNRPTGPPLPFRALAGGLGGSAPKGVQGRLSPPPFP